MPPPVQGPISDSRPWIVELGTLTRAPSAAESLTREPVRGWTARAGRAAAGPLAIGDSIVALQSTHRQLDVLWKATGERAWRVSIGGPGGSSPLISESALYVASSGDRGQVHAYNLETGRAAWRQRLGPVVGPLALSLDLVFAVTEVGRVAALDREDGRIVWEQRVGSPVRIGLTESNGELLLTTVDTLFVLDPSDGTVLHQRPLPATTLAVPAIAGGTMVFSSPDHRVFALRRSDLSLVWEVELASASYGSPAIARDTVFVTTIGGSMWKIPLGGATGGGGAEGATRIEIDVPMRVSAMPLNYGVLLGTITGEVLWVTDGPDPIWRVQVDGPIAVAPIVDQGVLLVVDGRGRVHTWH